MPLREEPDGLCGRSVSVSMSESEGTDSSFEGGLTAMSPLGIRQSCRESESLEKAADSGVGVAVSGGCEREGESANEMGCGG